MIITRGEENECDAEDRDRSLFPGSQYKGGKMKLPCRKDLTKGTRKKILITMHKK